MTFFNKLFEECYNNIPPEQKLEGELSYGIAEKIYATLHVIVQSETTKS